ncbi:hypothetical protein [Nocardia sp. NPDC059195]|uniref:hypothetical protein n=1 Tax=Nocardia sp. NPDC059195 TaxID=3346765 RepID=UPI00367DB212
MGYPYGPQQGQGYPPAGQQGYQPGGYPAPGPGGPGFGAPTYNAQGHSTPGPGAPSYGAPGHNGPGYSAPGHGMPGNSVPGYGAPQGPTSGTTGIIAAVLAVLLSLISLVSAVVVYNSPSSFEGVGDLVQNPDGSFSRPDKALLPEAIGYIAVCVIVSLLLLTGSILLFLRTMAGQVIAIVAAALSALVGAGSFALDIPSLVSINGPIIGMAQPVLSMVALALAVSPSTGRWIRAAQRRPNYPQGNYQRY